MRAYEGGLAITKDLVSAVGSKPMPPQRLEDSVEAQAAWVGVTRTAVPGRIWRFLLVRLGVSLDVKGLA